MGASVAPRDIRGNIIFLCPGVFLSQVLDVVIHHLKGGLNNNN